ncbi:hypothetical protein [Methylobrevis pamukkalensis]|uniref:Uncharacterized protein n=1 Tax=Methylobrevis pamukkalensis TaxID=1439726 RepID=A0A1E3GXJ0_9HYPH|nr:hypothetical protein [Methylobrevis pamukkalensis]ODN68724.1 hypothetical protein A6302_03977 [Methylobrevis pamukkalensis]
MPRFQLTSLSVFLALAAPALAAEPPAPDFKALLTPAVMQDIRGWIDTDIVRVSVGAQNDRIGKVSQTDIDRLDNQWKAERESADKPLIAATLSNPLSVYLARMQGRSLGLYAEIFVMDQNGLNVGQSSITSDFWQGDEGKFQKTFDAGRDGMFLDEAEWDDEVKVWRGQLSYTLTDAAGTTPIGAVTVEINLTELQRRAEAGS